MTGRVFGAERLTGDTESIRTKNLRDSCGDYRNEKSHIAMRSFRRRWRRGSPAGEARDDGTRDSLRHVDDEQYQQNAVNGAIQAVDIMPKGNA